MRGFIFGAVLGAFGGIWSVGALPEPLANFLNDRICDLAAMVGIGQGDTEGDPSGSGMNAGSADDGAVDPSLRYSGVFEAGHLIEVYTCPVMHISNQPAADDDGRLSNFNPLVNVDGVTIAAAPVSHGCLSSGFGPRGSRLHKGVDYYSREVSLIYAAGDGTIVEKVTRDDFGNMVVVDHGNGVYTRYAHMKNFASGLREGQSVNGETRLGQMGKTASYTIPVHLHYELLLGDFDTPKKSFGLEAKDPLSYPKSR